MNARFAGIQPELCNSFMNRRICSRSWRLAVRQLEGRIGADSAASYMELGRRASIHTHTHRVELAGRQPPVDWSLCHHDYRMRNAHPSTHRLETCHLTDRSCCRRYAYTVECWGSLHTYMHAHPQQGQRAARCCLGSQHSRRSRCWNVLAV